MGDKAFSAQNQSHINLKADESTINISTKAKDDNQVGKIKLEKAASSLTDEYGDKYNLRNSKT